MSDEKIDILLRMQHEARDDMKHMLRELNRTSAKVESIQGQLEDHQERIGRLETFSRFFTGVSKISAWLGGITLAISGILTLIKTFRGS